MRNKYKTSKKINFCLVTIATEKHEKFQSPLFEELPQGRKQGRENGGLTTVKQL